jgi:hypothetical protein
MRFLLGGVIPLGRIVLACQHERGIRRTFSDAQFDRGSGGFHHEHGCGVNLLAQRGSGGIAFFTGTDKMIRVLHTGEL